MSIDALIVPLLKAPLFADLDPFRLKVLSLTAERVEFQQGTRLTTNGAPGDHALLVVNGSVACIEGPDPSLIGVDLGPGTLLGELAMLIETHYGSTVVARTPVTAMRFARSAMHDLMLKDRGLAEHFASKIRARLSDIAHRLRAVEEAMQASDRMMPRRQMAG